MYRHPSIINVLKQSVLFCGLFFLYGVSQAAAATYYVSPTGKDANSGTGITSAWQTISKVNSLVFKAGDRILFEGGKTFSGSLYFDASDSGTATTPIEISSYGSGRAVITSGASSGLYVYNAGGFTVKNLNFVGGGYPTNTKGGVMFYADVAGDVKLPALIIESVESSGYKNGVLIGAWKGSTGYNGVTIMNANLFNNANTGLMMYGYTAAGFVGYAHTNVLVSNVTAHDNTGIANSTSPSGSGIQLAQVNHAVIERSVAYNNGALNTNSSGPVGIWAYGSNDVVMRYNESHHNHTGATSDGGGFDIDGGMTNSRMEYNYAHDNDGPGFLLAQYPGAEKFLNNVIRYNISENDGHKNGGAGIVVWNGNGPNGIGQSYVYNNTVYMDGASVKTPSAVTVMGNEAIAVQFMNNIFVTKNGATQVSVYSATPANLAVRFENNNYWDMDGSWKFAWGSNSYPTLGAWRTGTGQEMMHGVPVGNSTDPKLRAPGQGGTVSDAGQIQNLDAYQLLAASPLINTATPASELAGSLASLGDFNGDVLPQGTGYDYGADEFVATNTPLTTDSMPPTIPDGLSGAAVTDTRIDINWNNATDNVGVAGYMVYRDEVYIAKTTTASYSDEGLQGNSTHTYVVSAFDEAGNMSTQSSSIRMTTKSVTTTTVSPDSSWDIGAGVKTMADSNVYSRAGTKKGSKLLGVQFIGVSGTITAGPKVVNGVTWWSVNFITGVDGWVDVSTLDLTSVAYHDETAFSFSQLMAGVGASVFGLVNTLGNWWPFHWLK